MHNLNTWLLKILINYYINTKITHFNLFKLNRFVKKLTLTLINLIFVY